MSLGGMIFLLEILVILAVLFLLLLLVIIIAIGIFLIRSDNPLQLKRPFWIGFALFLLLLPIGLGFIRQAVLSCTQGNYTNIPAPLPSSQTLFTIKASPPRIVAFEARTGTIRWQHELAPNMTEGSNLMTERDNVVYVTGQREILDQENLYRPNSGLTAYRANDGALLWHTSLPNLDASFMAIHIAPLVADGLVYISTSPSTSNDSPSATANNSPGRIYALHANNGTLAWNIAVKNYSSYEPNRSLAVGAGLLFFSTQEAPEGLTVAVRAQDGHMVWQAPMGSDSLDFSAGTLYLSRKDRLVALRASDGSSLWTQWFKMYYTASSLAIAGQQLYIGVQVPDGGGGESEYLYAINALNGLVRWKYQVRNIFPAGGAPIEVGSIVYFPADGELYALRAQDGRLLWKHEASPNAEFGTLVVVQHVVFIQSRAISTHSVYGCAGYYEPSDALFALSTTGGSIYWRIADNDTDYLNAIMQASS